MAAATHTTTTLRTPSPGRSISRTRWATRLFTIRPIAGLNARSAGVWITGPSCAGSENEEHAKRLFRTACGRLRTRMFWGGVSGDCSAGDVDVRLSRVGRDLSLIHICEPTRLGMISYAV